MLPFAKRFYEPNGEILRQVCECPLQVELGLGQKVVPLQQGTCRYSSWWPAARQIMRKDQGPHGST